MRYITLEELIYIYTETIQRSGGHPGIRDEALLESVLAKPMVTFDGEDLYPDIITKTAVFVYSLLTGHPFHDGNQATALACMVFLLRANGFNFIATPDTIVETLQSVEAGQCQVDKLVVWLKRNTLPF